MGKVTGGGTAAGVLDWAFAGACIPGEIVSGDLAVVTPHSEGVLVAVIDGLGHGPGAARAARAAADVLSEAPERPVVTLVADCERALARLRGCVMSIASFNTARSDVTWLGIGNVEGVLIRPPAQSSAPPARERLLIWGGVVGHSSNHPRPATLPVRTGDTLVFVTDGVHASFLDDLRTDDAVDVVADRILERHATGSDDALVLAARYRGSSA